MGCTFFIVSAEVELLDELDKALVDLRTVAEQQSNDAATIEFRLLRTAVDWMPFPWSIWRGEELCERAVSDSTVVRRLLEHVGRVAMERADSRCLAVRGTAIARAGQAVLLVGDGVGSLAAQLLASGWGMLAHDFVMIDVPEPSGGSEQPTVRRCWYPLRIDARGPLADHLDGAHGGWDTLVPASQIASLATFASLAAVVCVDSASDDVSGIAARSPAATLGGLATHTPALTTDGPLAFDILADVVVAVPGATLRFDDPGRADEALSSVLHGALLRSDREGDNRRASR